MNAIVFTDTDAQTIIANQSRQHRLAPVQLTDGRWFLMEDVLTEPHFAVMLANITYDVITFDEIQPLLPVAEMEL